MGCNVWVVSVASTQLRPMLLTTPQAASLLGIERTTLWRMRQRGEAPCRHVLVGRQIRWPVGDLATLLGVTVDDLWHHLGAIDEAT